MNSQSLGDEARASATGRGADTLVCVALFAFTFWYCASAPYNLYVYDEGYFLYEAKRIVDGEVFYRDFFNIVTPLAWYVMAAAYWLFGVSMETARTTMAALHGVIAVSAVVACRMIGIRRSIAVVLGLSEAAVSYLAIERAAPHWFGTLWCIGVLLVLLRRPLTLARNAFVIGALVGGLVLTGQQRGVAMAWVPLAMLVLDHALLVLTPTRAWRPLIAGAAAYLAGLGGVVGAFLLLFVVLAGAEPVFTALVRYPLVNYRLVVQTPWGFYNPVLTPYSGPIVKYLSIVVPVVATLRCFWLWRKGEHLSARKLAVVLTVSVGALLGVAYGGAYEYIVLVGPIWFILIAEMMEVSLRVCERHWRRTWVVTTALVGAFVLLFAIRLGQRRRELTAQWPLVHETPFGRLAFASEADIAVLLEVTRIVGETGSRELFIYPTAPGLYLLMGANNVTRFQVFIPGYSSPEHVQEVLDLLEKKRSPFVLRNWIWMDNAQDRLLAYLLEKYEKVPLPFPPKQMRTLTLFRRKPESVESRSF